MKKGNEGKKVLIWISALFLGAILGCLKINALNELFNFISTVFTRLFQLVAIPTIALAVITTLSELSSKKNTGKIFAHTIFYTILTTFLAACVGFILYNVFTPSNIPFDTVLNGSDTIKNLSVMSYYDHILSIIPSNILQPLSSGNVLSVIITAACIGIGLSFAPQTENKETLIKILYGFQELLFTLIKALLYILPLGITAFSAQLSTQLIQGSAVSALGKYVFIVFAGNLLQIFVILPLILLFKGLNPFYIFKNMLPALTVAFFTKSSVGTLPFTLECAEKKLNVKEEISRFVLPVCTTINMNGCAAFILITSLFVMQNSGIELTMPQMVIWLFISVFAAIGNAGVPMGCYFLTLSLMSQAGANIGIMGVILPIYAIMDMVETVENVWSDSSVCAMVNKDMKEKIND